MRKLWIVLIVVGVLILGGMYYGISVGNQLVGMREQTTQQWAQVESQYQRRVDLIPNVVASVQGQLKQEKEIFTTLAEARSKYLSAGTPEARVQAAGGFDQATVKFLAVLESYPNLRSSETIQSLITELEGTENRISVERKRYNDSVGIYNARIQTFPTSLVASMRGFVMKPYFSAAPGSEVAPKVSL